MTETLALVLVILVDLAAAVGVGVLAIKWLKGWWFLGVVAGIAFEVVRILVSMAIVNPLHGFHSDTLGWLVTFRLFKIPILIGLGFIAGPAASRKAQVKQTTCPNCNTPIALNMAAIQEKATQAEGGPSQQYKEFCPKCKTELTYDVKVPAKGAVQQALVVIQRKAQITAKMRFKRFGICVLLSILCAIVGGMTRESAKTVSDLMVMPFFLLILVGIYQLGAAFISLIKRKNRYSRARP